MRRVVLLVDRLVLRGFERTDAPALAHGIEGELRDLLGADGAVRALATAHGSHTLRAGKARVPHGTGAATVGRAVAGRIMRGAKS